MKRYDAILFDFDGVLVDSEPVHWECWRQILGPFGIDLDWTTYAAQCIGVADRAMIEQLCALSDPPADTERLMAEYPRKKALFRARMEGYRFAPPTLDMLRELKPEYRLAVVSSSARIEVESVLAGGDALRYFDTLVCGNEAGVLKPDPAPYRLAAAKLGAKRPLVVEDSEAGYQSGTAAGFEVLRIPNASQTPELVRARL